MRDDDVLGLHNGARSLINTGGHTTVARY